MNKSEKELLSEVLATTLNMASDTIQTLFSDEKDGEFELKPEAKKVILESNVERVKSFKEKEKTEYQNGYKKAKGEVLTERDKEISEKYAPGSTKIGLELLEEIITLKTKAEDVDAEKVKAHPEFIKAEKEYSKKLKETEAALTKKYEDREKELAGEKTFSSITDKASGILKGLKPIFGTTDEAKQKGQIDRLLMSDLKQYDFVIEGDEVIVMKKDGKRAEDEHGKAITFESLVKDNASKHWDFQDGEGREGTGASNDEAAKAAAAKAKADGKVKYAKELPKTEEEYFKAFASEENPEQRVALYDEFHSEKT